MQQSPQDEERSPKRRKSSSGLNANATEEMASTGVIDVVADGDLILSLSGIAGTAKPVGLRVSSHVLAMTSPVFKAMLSEASKHLKNGNPSQETFNGLSALDDDGDAMLLLCNILHLRNNALPQRLPAETLCKLAALADKYQCAVAVGRATLQWFDRLYTGKTYVDTVKLVEAAYLLDETTYFARFTARWVLDEKFIVKSVALSGADAAMRRLGVELANRRQALIASVRADLDLILDPCSLGFSKASRHYIDYAPGMTPDADDDGTTSGSICHVDEQAGTTFLGALRDEKIWPSTVWPESLGAIVEALRAFRIPEYDDCDKCEFCEDVKTKFALAVAMVKKMHSERLWGLCLDCFKAGGVYGGECRYEHSKPQKQK